MDALALDDLGSIVHVSIRAALMFVVTLALVRLANKRFLGRYAAFDAVLAIILGSVISRAINGSARVLPTITAGVVLLALHWSCSALAFRSAMFRRWLKGRPRVLVQHGKLDLAAMRATHTTREDLLEELRYEAQIGALDEVEVSHLECNGHVSVVKRNSVR
jgi:uncharacterized membrane protein YcaP (DUF421 family)